MALEQLATRAGQDLEGASATEILQWARATFGAEFAITASMADGVLSHVASLAIPGVDVLFLDTGYHFAETLGTRDAVAATYDVNVKTVGPSLLVREHEADFNKLYEIDADMCCSIRKVWPLERALRPYTAWAGGVRRAEASTRAATPVVAWDAAPRQGEGQPDRRVDRRAGRGLRRRARHPRQPVAADRLHLDRVRPLHPSGRARRGPAIGSVGRAGQDRVRAARVTRAVYPLSLDLRGRRVLVVGGGPVAARRASGLADAGALVDVVAPFVCEDLRDDARVTLHVRDYVVCRRRRRLAGPHGDGRARGRRWRCGRLRGAGHLVRAGRRRRGVAPPGRRRSSAVTRSPSPSPPTSTPGGPYVSATRSPPRSTPARCPSGTTDRAPVTSPWSVAVPAIPGSSRPVDARCSPRQTSSSSTGSRPAPCSRSSTTTSRSSTPARPRTRTPSASARSRS